MNNMKNTKQKSIFRFLIMPSKSKKDWYTAFCFELCLIREGRDPLELKKQISKLAFNYYRSVVENNLDETLLNQSLPKTKKYKELEILCDKKLKEQEELRRKWEEILNKEICWKFKTEKNKRIPIFNYVS